jgi:hypothetical protein
VQHYNASKQASKQAALRTMMFVQLMIALAVLATATEAFRMTAGHRYVRAGLVFVWCITSNFHSLFSSHSLLI